jgi:succinoglycan biosynthesis transport protein ExoP
MDNKEKQPFTTPPEVKLHFLDYWRIIRVRKTVILAVFLLVTITTTVVTFLMKKEYASKVRMKVEKDTTDIPTLGVQMNMASFDPYWVQTEFEKIQSKLILYPVITNLGLNKKWAKKFKEEGDLRTDITYAILKSKIDVNQARNTSLIEIEAVSEEPSEAALIANEIAHEYRKNRLTLRQDMSTRGIHTLDAEFKKQDELVQKKQQLVDELKGKLQIADIEGGNYSFAPTVEPETLRRMEGLRVEAQAEYEKLNTMFLQLTNLSRAELKKTLVTVSPDQLLSELLSRQNLTEQKYAEDFEAYGPEHPEVKRNKKLLSQVEEQVGDRVDGIMEGLRTRVLSQNAQVVRLLAEVEGYKKKDIDAALQRRPYDLARRDLETAQQVRDRLWMRLIQEKVDAELPRSGIVEIIDPAEPSWRAVKPRKMLHIGLGVVFGLALGVGLAFFIEYLDTSVKTIDDVERALQAPVLGVIPQNVGNLMDEGPDSPQAEAYRVLRTNILFSQKDPKLNTVTIVSAGAGEGKSTTIFNLATIFAQQGQRVLVVDSDLRRPSVHKLFKVSNAIGLTNYLMKQHTLEEVIQTSTLPTLDFLPSGKLPSSSMGILNSTQMKTLMQELRRRYDWVFFDSPPIMGVSDASILASEVDMVLQVIQYRRYPQPMTIRAKQMIEKVGGNLLGIVLNNISMAADENYYYYSGYYYDYYSKQEEDGDGKPAKKSSSRQASEAQVEVKPKY